MFQKSACFGLRDGTIGFRNRNTYSKDGLFIGKLEFRKLNTLILELRGKFD
jgi:hypothetical protein